MKFVLIDTSVWSLVLRKKDFTLAEKNICRYVTDLIRNGYVIMIGPIRQEILSGISDVRKFNALKKILKRFLILTYLQMTMKLQQNISISAASMVSKALIRIT